MNIMGGMLCIMLSMSCLAESETQKLTEDEYNQRIQSYTEQVNATKKILDVEDSKASAKEQHDAFCSRLTAYQQIALMSKQNPELDTANIMLVIANRYLEQQKQSMEQSGMTLDVLCSKQGN